MLPNDHDRESPPADDRESPLDGGPIGDLRHVAIRDFPDDVTIRDLRRRCSDPLEEAA